MSNTSAGPFFFFNDPSLIVRVGLRDTLEAGPDNATRCHSHSHRVHLCARTFPARTSLTAGSSHQQCCLAGLGAAGADLIFVADSACKYVFVRLYCG